jgi:sugar lactone lactonase YvrE
VVPPKVECIQQANAILGEGPVWDWRSGDLFWIDIRRMQLFRRSIATGMQTGQWAFAERIGFVALTQRPGWVVVGVGLEVLLLELDTGRSYVLAGLDAGRSGHRINDASVDPRGRLWVGTMMDDFYNPATFTEGRLYRVDPDGTTSLHGGFLLPNGIGWSPDGTRMYLNDSVARTTYAFDFDALAGTIRNQRKFFEAAPDSGLPDGLSVDAEGNVWSAMWDGWAILKVAPDGGLLARHDMSVRRPSSATFGGPALDQLFITSATVGFTSADYARSPLAGGLFQMPAGCTGQRANLFALTEATLMKVAASER